MELDYQVNSVDVIDQIEFKFKNKLENIDSEVDQLKNYIRNLESAKVQLTASNEKLQNENFKLESELQSLQDRIIEADEKYELALGTESQKYQQMMLSYEEEIIFHKEQLDLELDALATLYELKIQHLNEDFNEKLSQLK